MENIIVWIVVIAALVFTIRSIVKTYRGDGGCDCAGGCTNCPSQDKDACGSTDFLKK